MEKEQVFTAIQECLSRNPTRPLFIPVAGGSCSGKTTISREISQHFKDSAIFSLDDYFKDIDDPNLPTFNNRISFDLPESYNLMEIYRHLEYLSQGEFVLSPVYDISKNKRTIGKKIVNSESIIVIDGLYAISISRELNLNQISIFIDIPYDIRLSRRLARDKVIATPAAIEHFFYYQAEPIYQKLILPQQSLANIIFSN